MTSAVTERPRAGRAYREPTAQQQDVWKKHGFITGRQLYIRMIGAFLIASIVGTIFISLGAVYLDEAKRIHDEQRISLPLVWCISGIVGGVILIAGSLVVAFLIITGQHKKEQQVATTSRNTTSRNTRVHYAVGSSPDGEVNIQLPPAYDDLDNQSSAPPTAAPTAAQPPAAVFTVTNTNNLPAAPPPYTESAGQPPAYTSTDSWVSPGVQEDATTEAWMDPPPSPHFS